MSPFARSMLLAIAMLGLSWSPGTLAGEITYIFDFVVSEMSDYLSGGGVNIGDRGTMIFRVNAATEPSRSGPTFRDYPAAIIGGGVTIGALAWTFDGAGQGTNDATLFNDQSAGPGSPFLIDLFALQGPLTGPPVNGLPPAFFSVALAAERPAPNDALASLSFPTSLDLAQFNALAQAGFGFFNGAQGIYGTDNYVLDIERIRVLPEPAALWLFAFAAAVTSRRTRSTVSRAAPARLS